MPLCLLICYPFIAIVLTGAWFMCRYSATDVWLCLQYSGFQPSRQDAYKYFFPVYLKLSFSYHTIIEYVYSFAVDKTSVNKPRDNEDCTWVESVWTWVSAPSQLFHWISTRFVSLRGIIKTGQCLQYTKHLFKICSPVTFACMRTWLFWLDHTVVTATIVITTLAIGYWVYESSRQWRGISPPCTIVK
jgi:hypothetical protein